MDRFAALVKDELARARVGEPKPLNSAHEAYGVLKEEVEEFWDEVKKKRKDRDPVAMLNELVQVAAMAQRAAEDLELISMPGWWQARPPEPPWPPSPWPKYSSLGITATEVDPFQCSDCGETRTDSHPLFDRPTCFACGEKFMMMDISKPARKKKKTPVEKLIEDNTVTMRFLSKEEYEAIKSGEEGGDNELRSALEAIANQPEKLRNLIGLPPEWAMDGLREMVKMKEEAIEANHANTTRE